jgi:glycosyltransferase involved in cell wall biosynthesis
VPKISVIVPAFNYGAYIQQCLESILAQRGLADLELVVVDDGSTDTTEDVVRGIRDDRLIYIRREQNLGHIATLNEGFARAGGKYFVHVGADDFWHADFLNTVVPFLDRFENVGLVHTNCALVNSRGEVTAERASRAPFAGDFQGNEAPFLLFENYFPPHGTLFRREALGLIGGGYSELMPFSEDWRLWLAIAKRADCQYVDRMLVYYRVHGRNLHSELHRTIRAEQSEIRILDEFFDDPGLSVQLQRLRRKAYAARYRHYADIYFGGGMMAHVRRCCRLAVSYDPMLITDTTLWRRYLGSMLHAKAYAGLKSGYHNVRGR